MSVSGLKTNKPLKTSHWDRPLVTRCRRFQGFSVCTFVSLNQFVLLYMESGESILQANKVSFHRKWRKTMKCCGIHSSINDDVKAVERVQMD